ncbi:MAG: HAMP domain-containing protein [Hyphomicrobium sp.]
MSIRLQLLGTIALVLLGTLMLGALLTYRHSINKIETEMRAAIAVGSRIAHNAVDDAEEVTNPRRRLELLVADFDGDRHLKAYLVEPDGAVRITSRLEPPDDVAPVWLVRLLDWRPAKVAVTLPSVFDGFGQFILETDARNEISEVWDDVQLFLTILASFCAAGLLVTLFILGRALRPLRRLTAAFHRIGAGDYAPRMPEGGPQEFVDLATGFNQMVGRLADMEGRNVRLMGQLETVQEEERAELARNLHDEVSPLIFCVDVDARAIRQMANVDGDPRIVGHAEAIQTAVANLKDNVKTILSDLRPSSLHALGLSDAIDDLIAFWATRRPDVTFKVSLHPGSWGGLLDDGLLAIIRESIANALKHGCPKTIEISVTEAAGRIALRVRNDGGAMLTTKSDSGFGVLGMTERASKLGGVLHVSSVSEGDGVIVTADIPASSPRRPARPKQQEASIQ